ncbi:hypothetical protein AUR64_11370 [Haloprofundus marisrubri]|uniref:DUF429 domain-containing protein n=1 Tax=Haloprofundus marisrubri TaxID=1514971 RepID=A0A0W1RC30_9EURY|nr:DUF429 domain-containing protein [Haloprofundus marisrubri]KTG10179.1 hypothetical protein AUR64_11370 [Haloprofundus marisrubri]
MTVVGVDGCPAGWVAATRDEDAYTLDVHEDFSTVVAAATDADASRLLVDIPIGLPEDGRRRCDELARERLGSRASTVFFAPCRAVLDAESHAQASDVNRERTGYGLSIQAWNLVPKIREVDAVLRADENARRLVREAHPELAFRALAGGDPVEASKSSAEGRERRRELLAATTSSADAAYERTISRTLRKHVARDDVLDALSLAAVASESLSTIPPDPPRDAVGLPMSIVGGPV